VPKKEVQQVDVSLHHATLEEEAIVQGDDATCMDMNDVPEKFHVTKNIASEDNNEGVQDGENKLHVLTKVVPSIEEPLIETRGSPAIIESPRHVVEAADMEVANNVQQSKGEEVLETNAGTTLEDTSFVTLNSAFEL